MSDARLAISEFEAVGAGAADGLGVPDRNYVRLVASNTSSSACKAIFSFTSPRVPSNS